MTHVLMVAYFYPPRESTATRRVEKFVKFLPAMGYQPIVLTSRIRGDGPTDGTNLVFRADEITGAIHRAYRNYRLRHVPAHQRATHAAADPQSRLERWRTMLSVPDHQIPWYPLAVREGYRILRSYPVRVLYSTSPPETCHLVALTLKQRTSLPWVADFRDGWMFEPGIPDRQTIPLRARIERFLERLVIRHADHILVVNESMADDLKHRYPAATSKISIITNGYDPDDFANLQRTTPSSHRFRLVYTGSLELSRWNTSIHGLLHALTALQSHQHPLLRDLEISLVGNLTARERTIIQESSIASVFTFVGHLPYPQALQYQVDADVLLLIIAPNALGISTNKLFEYLASGRPILALSGQTPAANIITRFGTGLVVDPNHIQGIQWALQTLHAQWQAGLLPTRVHPGVRAFDRRILTEHLASLFDTLIAQQQVGH